MDRNRDFDILRGFAVLGTFMAHAYVNLEPPQWIGRVFGLGWGFGVDIFFMLSGFLITTSLVEAMSKGPKAHVLKEFWTKRAFRILPASLFWLACASLAAAVFLPAEPSGWLGIARSAVSAILNFHNFALSYCLENNIGTEYCGGLKTIAVWWSLSLEEQFYIVLPLVLMMAGKRFTLVTALALACAYMTLEKHFPNLAWTTRLEGLCAGVALALLYKRIEWSRLDMMGRGTRTLLAYGAIFGALILVRAARDIAPAQLSSGLSMAMCFAAVFLASANRNVFELGYLSKIIHWFGTISFSFYLCHEIGLAFSYFFFTKIAVIDSHSVRFISFFALAMGISTVFAWISRDLLERPCIEAGKRVIGKWRNERLDGIDTKAA